MPLIDVGGVTLCYDTILGPTADPTATPVAMIQGLGMQLTEWPATLVNGLAAERPVILFDNRDAGLSQLFGPAVDPTLTMEDFPDHAPIRGNALYVLSDMAADVLCLLDALGIAKAHVIGFSMGGMIAQILAAQASPRVESLVGLMTSAGQAWLDCTKAADWMMRRSILFEPDRDRLVSQMLAAETVYAACSTLPDIDARHAAICQAITRAYRPAGIWRQARAMRAAGDRQALLGTIRVPVLMFHGEDDPVIDLNQASIANSVIPQTDFKKLTATGHILTEPIAEIVTPIIRKFWGQSETIL